MSGGWGPPVLGEKVGDSLQAPLPPLSSAHLQVTPSEGWEKVKVESLSPVHLWDPMDCSPPGSSVHGITQVRILEWAAIHFSRGSS